MNDVLVSVLGECYSGSNSGLVSSARLNLLPWFPPPVACVHDEQPYLLGPQNVAAGRATNRPTRSASTSRSPST